MTPPGEGDDEALRAGRQSTSLDFLLDALLDMSAAALVSYPGSPTGAAGGAVGPQAWPAAMRSPFEQRAAHAARDMAAVPKACILPRATLQEA